MARTIECAVAVIKDGLQLPLPGLELKGKTPADCLNEAANSESGERLRLGLSFPTDHNPRLEAGAVAGAWQLHTFLESVTRNVLQVKPAERVGLLLSDYWPHDHTVLGVMFDTTFGTEFTPGGGFGSVPREGCAVFLKALAELRPTETDYRQEAFFTCVHELGHVFNLWHDLTRPNFLRWPDPDQPTPDDAFEFSPAHQRFLSMVDSASEVYPGGSDFGVRGTLGPQGSEEGVHLRAQTSRQRLQLRINLSQSEMAFFEPVELDITVQAIGSRTDGIRIPSRVDPGYPDFVVWIEGPDGSRRSYRSPRRYCGGTDSLSITPGRPFHRDLSIFAESGRFTFFSPGEHRVYATFLLPDQTVLRSNTITVNVRGRYGSTAFADHVQDVLTSREPVRLLYHRSGKFHYTYVQELRELARRGNDPMLEANLYYALGRYFEKTSQRVKSATWRRRNRERAAEALGRALECQELSEQRRRNAKRCLRDLEDVGSAPIGKSDVHS